MRQARLGERLGSLLERDLNSRCTIATQATGDVDAPTWTPTRHKVAALIVDASARDRQARGEEYSHPLTHTAVCIDSEHLKIDCQISEAEVKTEAGDWEPVASAVRVTYLILGKFKVNGMPEPRNQVRLDLWQVTGTR